jgi:hypothetical protein
MEPATLERIAAHNDAGRLNAVDGSAYFATFSALTVLYAAAWIAISNLMRARMAVKCDSGRMADQAASLEW